MRQVFRGYLEEFGVRLLAHQVGDALDGGNFFAWVVHASAHFDSKIGMPGFNGAPVTVLEGELLPVAEEDHSLFLRLSERRDVVGDA